MLLSPLIICCNEIGAILLASWVNRHSLETRDLVQKRGIWLVLSSKLPTLLSTFTNGIKLASLTESTSLLPLYLNAMQNVSSKTWLAFVTMPPVPLSHPFIPLDGSRNHEHLPLYLDPNQDSTAVWWLKFVRPVQLEQNYSSKNIFLTYIFYSNDSLVGQWITWLASNEPLERAMGIYKYNITWWDRSRWVAATNDDTSLANLNPFQSNHNWEYYFSKNIKKWKGKEDFGSLLQFQFEFWLRFFLLRFYLFNIIFIYFKLRI